MRVGQRSVDANRYHRIGWNAVDDVTNRRVERRGTQATRSQLAPNHRPRGKAPKLPPHVRLTEMHDHEPLRLVYFGNRRSLDGARVEHRRSEGAACKIRVKHLVTVNVAREHRGKV